MRIIIIIFFLTLKSTAQISFSKEIESFEIKSKSKSNIDSAYIFVDAKNAVRIRGDKQKVVNENDRNALKKFIADIFITKKYNVFKKIEKIEGFRYSSDQILIISLKYNENETDMYYVDLTVPNYKVEYSNEFKAFMKLFHSIR